MHFIDLTVFAVYILVVLGIGYYFFKRNKDLEDYYVGGRNMGAGHIGLSVVATDVGGGFSIGLGGLGFTMGLSGSWMLLTGLVGAWLSAVFLIPKVFNMAREKKLLSFPQILNEHYGKRVAFLAGIISAIGYIGFSASQLLAGAKLAVGTMPELTVLQALLIMGAIAVGYTVIGGMKAVIYTDTVQWAVLISGLVFLGIPFGFHAIGGVEGLRNSVRPELLRLHNISWSQGVNWFFTIVPIWFIGMTLYQRIFACKDEKTAKRAWYIAGLFEYPVMAFMGVTLGLFARAAADQGMFAEVGYASVASIDAEVGLPMLLRHVMPVGLLGLMLSAYFSAIMSTADSCLMAASGNIQSDILLMKDTDQKKSIRASQLITLAVGLLALVLAAYMTNVLDLMLHSYAFMVSGLLMPVLGFLFFKKVTEQAALASMFCGGGTTLGLTLSKVHIPFGLDPIIPGLLVSFIAFVVVQALSRK